MKISKQKINNAVRTLVAEVPPRLLSMPGFSKQYCIARANDALMANDQKTALKMLLLVEGMYESAPRQRKTRSKDTSGNGELPANTGLVC